MGDVRQGRPVRGPTVVVLDRPAGGVVGELVAEPGEDAAQLVVAEQEEQHHRVGLLGQLVAVRGVALGLEDPVEALDVAVLRAVGVPVQFLEVGVALELADDPVVERHEHPAADVLPPLDLLVAELQPGADGVRAWCRQQVEQVRGDVADPRHEDVGVGVVAQAALGRARVLLVVLVRAHDAVDLVALPLGRVMGDRRPEPCDAEHELRALGLEEQRVLGGGDVLPDVVEDRRADVPLVVGQVDVPRPRHRVEVDLLGLLGAERCALPREHEAGAAGGPGGGARLGQAPVAVHEQAAGDPRQAVGEERQDEQFVPEHVAAVGLAVDPAGGDAGVEIGGIG